jgi:hypothetical protein
MSNTVQATTLRGPPIAQTGDHIAAYVKLQLGTRRFRSALL